MSVNVNMVRTISGLSLPVRCFLVDYFNLPSLSYIGSCNYTDACVAWRNYYDMIFGEELQSQCPFNTPPQFIDLIKSINIPDLSQNKYMNFLAFGDFDLKLTFQDSVGFFGCFNFKFTMKKAV